MKIQNLRINHIDNPLGYDFTHFVFSWNVEGTIAKKQKAARVCIYRDVACKDMIYDTGMRTDINSTCCLLQLSVEPRTRYYCCVEILTETDEHCISDIHYFETAKLDEPWSASWITAPFSQDRHPIFQKTFFAEQKINSARMYICGLGLYEANINGEKVGHSFLTPGFHSYDLTIQYQTYDITELLSVGNNNISVMLGNGWYKGRIGFDGGYTNLYGDHFRLICEIHIIYHDGTETVWNSDNSWKCCESPVISSGIYDGEVYDARVEKYNAVYSNAIIFNSAKNEILSANKGLPVVIQKTISPVEFMTTSAEETVIDFGQNMTGWVSFECSLPEGKQVKLEYGETLQNGCFYRENLRTAKAEYIYISSGRQVFVRPHFTYYGFRYVRATGFSKEDLLTCRANQLISDIQQTGSIVTGNEKVNKLFQNILWSQKDNFLDVPTDCPQRDERMGWTGDAQIFSNTACFNMYTPVFFEKYLFDLRLEQQVLRGSVPFIVPRLKPISGNGFISGHGASPWSDAAVIIPWNIYLQYGDKAILRENYGAMKSWVEYQIKQDEKEGNDGLIKSGFHFGDWLALDNYQDPSSPMGKTDPYFVASVYYYYSTLITAQAAEVLGIVDDSIAFTNQSKKIIHAIQNEYFSPAGRCAIDTQTALILTIFFKLLSKKGLDRTAAALIEKLRKNGNHFDTGFVGTPLLCRSLSMCGRNDIAYSLLLNESYPGWLYEVNLGATTVWERWNSILEDGHMSGTGMNSLNHYAYGSIAEWLYRDICGINYVAEKPGYKMAKIAPHPDGRIKFAELSLMTESGKYEIFWKVRKNGDIEFKCAIPFDAEAILILPDCSSDKIVAEAKQYSCIQQDNDVEITLPSGTYSFIYTPTVNYIPHLSANITIKEIFADKEVIDIINTYVGDSFIRRMKSEKEGKSLFEILNDYHYFDLYDQSCKEQLIKALECIPTISYR